MIFSSLCYYVVRESSYLPLIRSSIKSWKCIDFGAFKNFGIFLSNLGKARVKFLNHPAQRAHLRQRTREGKATMPPGRDPVKITTNPPPTISTPARPLSNQKKPPQIKGANDTELDEADGEFKEHGLRKEDWMDKGYKSESSDQNNRSKLNQNQDTTRPRDPKPKTTTDNPLPIIPFPAKSPGK